MLAGGDLRPPASGSAEDLLVVFGVVCMLLLVETRVKLQRDLKMQFILLST